MSTTRTAVAGFTIFELIVSMAVAAILGALALPSFAEFIDDNRLRGVATELMSDLNLARGEAIKRNARVLVCPKVGNSDCASNANNKWSDGWLVCYDVDADGKCDAGTDTDPNPIRSVNPVPAGVTFGASAADVRYTATGSTTGQVTWDISGSKSKVKRTITAAATGSVTLVKK